MSHRTKKSFPNNERNLAASVRLAIGSALHFACAQADRGTIKLAIGCWQHTFGDLYHAHIFVIASTGRAVQVSKASQGANVF